MSSGPEKKGQFVCFLYKKKTRQKSASSEPLISCLALLLGKLWTKNNKKFINYQRYKATLHKNDTHAKEILRQRFPKLESVDSD